MNSSASGDVEWKKIIKCMQGRGDGGHVPSVPSCCASIIYDTV